MVLLHMTHAQKASNAPNLLRRLEGEARRIRATDAGPHRSTIIDLAFPHHTVKRYQQHEHVMGLISLTPHRGVRF